MDPQGNEWSHPCRKNHEGHIASKGYNSMTHFNLVHKFVPMPQSMKITDATAAVDKGMEEARNDSGLADGKI